MKKYKPNEEGWYCGHWNNSPLQIKHSSGRPIKQEQIHTHPFAEYYLVLNGELTIQVRQEPITLKNLELLMVEANEPHQIIKKHPSTCSYIIIKEESIPNNKQIFDKK